jgi:hypothetical protein
MVGYAFILKNTPSTFTRLMNELLKPFLSKFVVVYINNIMIFIKTKEKHLRHLQQVLEQLK